MPTVLRPDAKAAVWLAIGFVVVPKIVKMARR